jgi:hypothetical protein
MRAWLVVGLVLVAGLGILPAVPSQGAGPVEAEYTGDWVCQAIRPGYNIRPPSADASQPLTNHMTTPSTVVVLKLTLRTDGTYVAADGHGRFALDPAAKTIAWLDGPYRDALRKTQLGRRGETRADAVTPELRGHHAATEKRHHSDRQSTAV